MNSMYSVLVVLTIIGLASSFIAKTKGRNQMIWFCVGFSFSLLGLLVLLLLPSKKKQEEERGPATVTALNSMNSEAALPNEDEGYNIPLPSAKRIKLDPTLLWYYIQETKDKVEIKGPVTLDNLRRAVVYQNLPVTTYIWCDEFVDWTQIQEFQNMSVLTDKELIIDEEEKSNHSNANSGKSPSPPALDKTTNESL